MQPDTKLRSGDQFLSGGTWLFSAPHPEALRLVDLTDDAAEPSWEEGSGLALPAALRLGNLSRWAAASDLEAAGLFVAGINGLSSSWKIIERSTVGGNIGLSLAKGAMTPLCLALDGIYELEGPDEAKRVVSAENFQTGSMCNVLMPQEYVRRVLIPASAMHQAWALERITMTAGSHVATNVIGTWDPSTGQFSLAISAVLTFPVRIDFSTPPADIKSIHDAIDARLQGNDYMDDQHGSAPYRHAMARYLAERVLAKLSPRWN